MSIKTKTLFVVAYLLHFLWIILLATVPPVSRDALTHHLAVPKLWVERGGIYEMPEIIFSYYPQLVDLLYTIPLALGNDIAAKYVHFTFALLTALIIVLFVRRRIGPVWGALAGLLFLTIPLIVKLSVTVYVDLGLIFFTTAALFGIVTWLEDTSNTKWLVLAAVCSGLALSTKYSAIISFLVLSLFVPFFFLNGRENKEAEQLNAVKFGVLFVTVSLLVFSPWLIRNYSLTGNPIYPLQQGLFAAQPAATSQADEDLDSESHARQVLAEEMQNAPKPLGPLLIRKLVHEESLPYTLLIPLRLFYEGQDDDPKYFDGRLNLLLLLLPLALLLTARKQNFRHREIAIFAYYALLVVLLTFLTKDMRARWISSIIPPLVVLSTYSLYVINKWLLQRFPVNLAAHPGTVALVFLYLLPNVIYSHGLYKKIDPLPYVTGTVSREEYIQIHRPEYAAIALANEVVPADGKVLGLYLGNRRYYFSADAILLNSVFISIAENADSGEGIAETLTRLGYTHLLIRNDLFDQWVSNADEAIQARVADFAGNRLKLLVIEEGYGLYEVVLPGA